MDSPTFQRDKIYKRTVVELKQKCREKGIRGYSLLNKEELLDCCTFKTIGIFIITSSKVHITDPEFKVNQVLPDQIIKRKKFPEGSVSGLYNLRVKNGSWVAEVEEIFNRVATLQVIHENYYKENKSYNWDDIEWEEQEVWSSSGDVGIFDISIYPNKQEDMEIFAEQTFQATYKLYPYAIFQNKGVVSRAGYLPINFFNRFSVKIIKVNKIPLAIRMKFM